MQFFKEYFIEEKYDDCEVLTRPSFFRVRPAVFLNRTFPVLAQTFYVQSQTFPFFGSVLPEVSPSHFTSQTFPFFPVSPSHFSKSVFLIFRVRPSHSFRSVLLIFRVRPSHFFRSVLPTFPSQFFSFFESYILPIFFTVSFWILPVLCSDLIAMYTVDKIKDVGVCRKRLHCTTNSLARETNQ